MNTGHADSSAGGNAYYFNLAAKYVSPVLYMIPSSEVSQLNDLPLLRPLLLQIYHSQLARNSCPVWTHDKTSGDYVYSRFEQVGFQNFQVTTISREFETSHQGLVQDRTADHFYHCQ